MIPGDGRENPKPAQRPKTGTDSLAHLNFARGTRIRVVQDNGRRGLIGLEGVVVQSLPGAVVVELENDPAVRHRVTMDGGISVPRRRPLRHFHVTEVERA